MKLSKLIPNVFQKTPTPSITPQSAPQSNEAMPVPITEPSAEPVGVTVAPEPQLYPEIPEPYGILRNGSLYYPVCGNRVIPMDYQTNPLLDCKDHTVALRFHTVGAAVTALKQVVHHKTDLFGIVDRAKWPTA